MLLSKAVPTLDELWRKPANSAQDRRMGKIELPLGHHLDRSRKLLVSHPAGDRRLELALHRSGYVRA
jgi:hypothetical protein